MPSKKSKAKEEKKKGKVILILILLFAIVSFSRCFVKDKEVHTYRKYSIVPLYTLYYKFGQLGADEFFVFRDGKPVLIVSIEKMNSLQLKMAERLMESADSTVSVMFVTRMRVYFNSVFIGGDDDQGFDDYPYSF